MRMNWYQKKFICRLKKIMNTPFSFRKLIKQKMQNDSIIRITEMNQLEKELEKMTQTLDLVRERLDNSMLKLQLTGSWGCLMQKSDKALGEVNESDR